MHCTIPIVHKGNAFVLDIYFSAIYNHCNVYQLVPGKDYSEVIGFDSYSNRRVWYSDHFFYRYATRFHVSHKTHHEVVTHYFEHNPIMVYDQGYSIQNGHQCLKAVVHNAIVYCYYDLKNRVMKFTTDIDFFSANNKKRRQTFKLRNVLKKVEKAAWA